MTEAFQGIWPQDRNVSRQNLRHEKRLKKQLDVLEKERHWRSKSLEADKRCFEEKAHRLNMKPTDRAHLAKDTNDMVATDKKKELDRLLKSLLHRPYETRAGYSYIEYLSRNMQPLVKRPLQWGVNPPLSSPRFRLPVDACQTKTEQKPSVFLTRIEGQTVSLNQRVALPLKRKEKFKPEQVVLPPIRAKPKLPLEQIRKFVPAGSKSPKQVWKSREVVTKEPHVTQTTKLRKKSKETESRNICAQEKVTTESNESAKEIPEENTAEPPRERDTFVTKVRLDVPSPNYYHLEVPTINDETLRDQAEYGKTNTPELESQSRSYYSFSIVALGTSRRKSI